MKRKTKDQMVLRAMTVGIAAMLTVTSMPAISVYAEELPEDDVTNEATGEATIDTVNEAVAETIEEIVNEDAEENTETVISEAAETEVVDETPVTPETPNDAAKETIIEIVSTDKADTESDEDGKISADENAVAKKRAEDAAKELKEEFADVVGADKAISYVEEMSKTHVTNIYVQKNNDDLEMTDGKFTSDNASRYDLADGEVVSRPTDKFEKIGVDVETPAKIFDAYINYLYNAFSNGGTKAYSEVIANSITNGKGISIGHVDEDGDRVGGTLPIIYWALDVFGKLTGETFTDVNTKENDGKKFFVGYTFKHESDKIFHIDGVFVTYKYTEPTPEPEPDPEPIPDPEPTPDPIPEPEPDPEPTPDPEPDTPDAPENPDEPDDPTVPDSPVTPPSEPDIPDSPNVPEDSEDDVPGTPVPVETPVILVDATTPVVTGTFIADNAVPLAGEVLGAKRANGDVVAAKADRGEVLGARRAPGTADANAVGSMAALLGSSSALLAGWFASMKKRKKDEK